MGGSSGILTKIVATVSYTMSKVIQVIPIVSDRSEFGHMFVVLNHVLYANVSRKSGPTPTLLSEGLAPTDTKG